MISSAPLLFIGAKEILTLYEHMGAWFMIQKIVKVPNLMWYSEVHPPTSIDQSSSFSPLWYW